MCDKCQCQAYVPITPGTDIPELGWPCVRVAWLVLCLSLCEVYGRTAALPSVIAFLARLQGCGVGSSSERTRTAITAALKKKLKDIMGDFSALRQKLQLEYRSAPFHM